MDLEKAIEYLANIQKLLVEYGKKQPEQEAKIEQQSTEAVEFKDWCDSGRQWFFDNNEEHTHTTQELYEIFKNGK